MMYVIKENSERIFHDLEIENLPKSLPNQITIIKKDNHYGFKVGNIIGVFPFGINNFLNIKPKYEAINVHEMIFYLEGLEKNVLSETRSYLGNGELSVLNHIIINKFVKELIEIESQSLKFVRQRKKGRSDKVKGKINWNKTILNTKKKVKNPIESEIFYQEYNIPENIILSFAASVSKNFCIENSPEWNVLNKWSKKFPISNVKNNIETIAYRLKEHKIQGARYYYKNAIISAKIILDFSGVRDGNSLEAPSFLLNTPEIYEKFVRKFLMNSLSIDGILVRKGFIFPHYLLENEVELIPDLVFQKFDKIIAIGDVKYKDPSPSDFQQLYCYLKVVNCNTGIIFTPTKNDTSKDIEIKEYFDGQRICIVYMPSTNHEDLEKCIILLKKHNII